MASDDTRYNGWTNYETWAVKLWMDNEESSYRYWEAAAQEALDEAEGTQFTSRDRQAKYGLAERLKNEFQDAAPELEGMWADLLGAALSEVDWYEIAEALLEDKTPSDEEEEDED